MPHLHHDLRLFVPAIVLTFEEVSEEALLQGDARLRIIFSPMFETVEIEPLLGRFCLQKALDVAAQVKSLAAPIGCRQEGSGNFCEVRQAALPKWIASELWLRAYLSASRVV